MKKIISMALVLIMLVCSVATLTACGMPSDYKDAEANLKDAEYDVDVETTDAAIEFMLGLIGVEDAKANAMVSAEKDKDAITIFYCEDKDTAKAVEEKLAEFVEEMAEEFEDYNEIEIGRDGEIVYFGTKQAIKDAK